MRSAFPSLVLLALSLPAASRAADAPDRGLSIFFTDTEGGAATLIVTPAGESVLIDPGYPGERDASRVLRTAKEMAGLTRIDHFICTHWHVDHVGGIVPLSEKIPVERFYDRGLPPSPRDGGTDPKLVEAYQKLTKGRSKVLRAGDEVPLKQGEGAPPVSLRCIVANAMPEGGAEAAARAAGCSRHAAHPADLSDNAKSLGFLLKFGGFKFLDLGDITWNVEHALVCPEDRIGRVDAYQVTHHGLDLSNNPLLLDAVSPRVAIMPNGPHKGGAKSVYAGLKALKAEVFQLHRNVETADSDNAPPDHIANLKEDCDAEPISVKVAADGKTYSVKIGRAGAEKTFSTR